MTVTEVLVRDLFINDPTKAQIPNNGVAEVDQEETLAYELRSFVCEGQYAKGLERILSSYLSNYDKDEQPAAWVSGFYGSGKSHLVKMLRYLWTDDPLPTGASPRGLVTLSDDIAAHLKELNTLGRRGVGLHAAAGTLQLSKPLRLGLLSLIFRSRGLPEDYAAARFVLFLQQEGAYDALLKYIENAGRSLANELQNLYVSPTLAQALVEVMPGFATSPAEAKSLIKAQFKREDEKADITDDEMLATIEACLAKNGKLPCTLLVLDELQQYIGDNADRAYEVQLVTQTCCKRFGGRLLFVGTGQSALAGMPSLGRIQARFTVPVELSDADVETVTRKLVLAKKPDQQAAITGMLEQNSGEISRHLRASQLRPCPADQAILVADYPLLPVRRRFWERALRALDRGGTTSQLRTQLSLVAEGVRAVAEQPLGAVIPADFIFEQISAKLSQAGVLLKDINDTINKQKAVFVDGELRYRLAALVYLIGELPPEIGVRRTPEMLADLLVGDLGAGTTALRQQIPAVLEAMFASGDLMKVEDIYLIQTPEGARWEGEFQRTRVASDELRVVDELSALLKKQSGDALSGLQVNQGVSKETRKIELHFSLDPPPANGTGIPVWIRDGWSTGGGEKTVRADARQAGTGSPVVFVYLPRHNPEAIKNAVANMLAARETIYRLSNSTTSEGEVARRAMETRGKQCAGDVDSLLREILDQALVLQGGGNEVTGSLRQAVAEAANAAAARLFIEFPVADHAKWPAVAARARTGDGAALEAIGYHGEPQDHPVCKALLDFISSGKQGSQVRQHFRAAPYGWPQDAIDGALVTLTVITATGALTAHHQGQMLKPSALDGTRIGVAEFRRINVGFDTNQRLAIRRLLSDAGIGYKTGEEIAALPGFLAHLKALAEAAGGDAPKPERPSVTHLLDLEGKSGNELGVAVCELRDRLDGERKAWTTQSAKVTQRWSRWETLLGLQNGAAGLPEAGTVDVQIAAIRTQRLLLADPDPITPLGNTLADLLRQTLVMAHAAFDTDYRKRLAELQEAPAWQALTAAQREHILQEAGIAPPKPVNVVKDSDILHTLKERSLPEWRNLTDALPARFSRALAAAVKLRTPEAVTVTLPHRTLSTPAEVDAYLDEVKALVLEQINAGKPVMM